MKRYLSILSVIALLVSLFSFAPVVNADPTAIVEGVVAEVTGAEGTDDVHIRLNIDASVDDQGHKVKSVTAELVGKKVKAAQKIEGTWKISVDKRSGEKDYQNNKVLKFNLPEEYTTVKVVFEGKIDGEEVKVEAEKKKKDLRIKLRFETDFKKVDKRLKIIPKVEATLVGPKADEANEVKGNWTVYVDGKVHKRLKDRTEKTISVKLPEYFTNIKVVFVGLVDGQLVEVEKEYEFTNADVEITHKEVEGKDEFTATIKGVQQAKGTWFLAYGDDEKMIDFFEGKGGATFTHAFENVKPGEYIIVAFFEGTINGEDYVVLGNDMAFEKKEDGSGEVKPPAEEPDDEQPPVHDPEETKEQIDEAKNGGKLPKTATTYPLGAVAGLVLLAIGVIGFAVLKLRRGRA